jgi:hypothetical protein
MQNERSYRVSVKPGDVHMPGCCVVCGGKVDGKELVRFTSAAILPGIGGIESIPFEMPVCASHRQEYRSRWRRYQLSLAATFLSGIGMGCCASAFLGKTGSPGPLGIAAMVLCAVFIFSSFGIFLTRARCFPVRFRARQGRLFTGYSEFIFTFPKESAAKAFAEANGVKVEAS